MSKFQELRKYVKEKRIAKYKRLKTFLKERDFAKETFNDLKGVYILAAILIPLTVLNKYCGCDREAYSKVHQNYLNVSYSLDSSKVDSAKHIKSVEDTVK